MTSEFNVGDLVRLTDDYRANWRSSARRKIAPWVWEVGLIVEVLEGTALVTLFPSGVVEMNPHTPLCLVEEK